MIMLKSQKPKYSVQELAVKTLWSLILMEQWSSVLCGPSLSAWRSQLMMLTSLYLLAYDVNIYGYWPYLSPTSKMSYISLRNHHMPQKSKPDIARLLLKAAIAYCRKAVLRSCSCLCSPSLPQILWTSSVTSQNQLA